jgi:hypothetical protein
MNIHTQYAVRSSGATCWRSIGIGTSRQRYHAHRMLTAQDAMGMVSSHYHFSDGATSIPPNKNVQRGCARHVERAVWGWACDRQRHVQDHCAPCCKILGCTGLLSSQHQTARGCHTGRGGAASPPEEPGDVWLLFKPLPFECPSSKPSVFHIFKNKILSSVPGGGRWRRE